MKISICDICGMPLKRGAVRHSVGKLFWRVDICAECMSLIKSERLKEIRTEQLEQYQQEVDKVKEETENGKTNRT